MSVLKINLPAIGENIQKLNALMQMHNKEWSLVVKVLASHEETLRKIFQFPCIKQVHSIGVSHWQSLKLIKAIDPAIQTMFIKPPAISNARRTIKYADISFNSSALTIQALNTEAQKKGIIHKTIVAIEMGELREGIHREELVAFYEKIFNLSNIEVIGLGTNLGCMHGIRPTYDKLIQLTLYKQILEYKFQHPMPLVSGGSSITLPLLEMQKVPVEMNHFRIGEAAFLGTSPLYNKPFADLRTDTFEFEADILELYSKDNIPDGEITDAAIGLSVIEEETDLETGELSLPGKSYKAICDFGMLNVNATHLTPLDESVKFFGNSSDMTVFDMGLKRPSYKTGDVLKFKPDYTAVASLMLSPYVEKQFIE
ncbi:MAG: alanine racemase [Candidatus Cloacimonadaceae bacterium]